jgi:hypothetical protein
VSWLATMQVDSCARSLGRKCKEEIGIDYKTLPLALAKLGAAIEAGKCDGAYPVA